MEINYLGHSCFKIKKDGFSLIIDPYENACVPGYRNLDETANMVICSHAHHDHNGRSAVRITDGPKCPFEIEQIETYHDHHKGARRGMNSVTIIKDGDTRLAHLGDLGFVPGSALNKLYSVGILDEQNQNELLEKLRNIDILLIPIGGTYTITAHEAAELVKELRPKRVIPMHYRGDGFGFSELETVDRFCELVPEAEVITPEKL